MLGVHGIATVLGRQVPASVSWIAGVGHILLTIGLVLLFVLLGKRLSAPESSREAHQPSGSSPSAPNA